MSTPLQPVRAETLDKARTSVLIENVVAEMALNGSQESMEKPSPVQRKENGILEFLSSSGKHTVHITAEDEARLVRKIDRHVIPIIFGISFLHLLDKKALSSSAVFGLSQDAHLSGDEYSMLGSFASVAQLAVLPISAYFLVKLNLSIYVPILVTGWGISLTCMGAARNFVGLLSSRLFLGAFEASVQASFILTIQVWYRRNEQGFRLAWLFSSIGWANIFGSLMMFGVGHIKSHALHPYQLISFLLGGITLLIGLLSFFIFPDNVVQSKFLSTHEKIVAIERLRANQQGFGAKDFRFKQVLETFMDVKSWFWMIMMFTTFIPVSGFAVFGPLIIKGFGFDGNHVMLLMMPYGALQIIIILGGFWLNRRYRLKAPIILGGLLFCVAAAVILLKVDRSHKHQSVLLFAYYLTSIFSVVPATIANWQSSNVAGDTKKSTTTVFMHIGGLIGEIVGPFVFSQKDEGYYHKGIAAMLICYAACSILVVLTVSNLWYLNNVNRKRRVANGKAEKIIDYSMFSAAEAERHRLDANDGVRVGETPQVGSHAFDDLTDLENDEFIYVY